MYTGNEDFYQVLGVSPEATGKEIKAQYKKLMLENHPDKFKGLKVKHEAGDEDLLEIIEERIRRAEEESKLINQAFEVLSDSTKRKEYDDLYKTTVAGPEIVLSTNKLDLGRLTEDQKKTESFVIENKGGPVTAVLIDWESEPDWGELLIELTPVETFPIKVTVGAKAEGATAGPKKERIFIEVDGDVQTVEVTLTVAAKVAKTTATAAAPTGATPPPTPPPPGGSAPRPARPILSSGSMKAYMTCSVVAALMIIGALVMCALNLSFEEKQQAARQQEQEAQKALVNLRETQEAVVQQAQEEERQRIDEESRLLIDDLGKIVSFRRLPGEGQSGENIPGLNCGPGFGLDVVCAAQIWGEYEVINLGRYVTLRIYNRLDVCVAEPREEPQNFYELRPGERVKLYCKEHGPYLIFEEVFLTLWVDIQRPGVNFWDTYKIKVPVSP